MILSTTQTYSVEMEERDGFWLAMARRINDLADARRIRAELAVDYPTRRTRVVVSIEHVETFETFDAAVHTREEAPS